MVEKSQHNFSSIPFKITVNPMKENYSEYCRTCARQSSDLRSLFKDGENERNFAEIVELCTSVTLCDDLLKPTSICNNCIVSLKTAYEFYNLVRSSEEKFNEWTKQQSSIKLESIFVYEGIQTEELPNQFPDLAAPSTKELCEIEDKSRNAFAGEPEEVVSHDEDNQPLPLDSGVETRQKPTPLQKQVKKSVALKIKPTAGNESVYKYECYKCKSKFRKWIKVHEHLQHDNVSKSCRICVKNFTSCEYKQHSCIGAAMSCEYCEKSFNTTCNLVTHIKAMHKRHRVYKCLNCVRVFSMKLFLDVHKPLHTSTQSHMCAICGKSFSNTNNLQRHQKQHTRTKSIACPKCPKRFIDNGSLKKHMDVHEDTVYSCDLCDVVMRNKVSFYRHKKRHENIKFYTCEICSKQIKYSLHNLKQHMTIHTGEKPFGCPHCDRSFSTNADRNKHLRIHIGQNIHKCDNCEKSFRLVSELRRHAFEHYEQDVADGGIQKESTN